MHNHCGNTLDALGDAELVQRYTQREAGRILGLEAGRLRYWARLRLVRPQFRWGERFYTFGDLVALRTVQRLTSHRIPAKRLRTAVTMVEREFGAQEIPLQELRLVERGRDVAVVPPGAVSPLEPLSGQWFLPFSGSAEPEKIHSMSGRSAEELFESAIEYESRAGTLEQAVDNYRRVIELEPDWVEAHINLGVALYQMGRTDEARTAFRAAVDLDPTNGISRYNLGCVLEEQGQIDEAIEHLRSAARMMPSHADVHFNLALAYDKRGERQPAQEQWTLYLRYAPNGPWADQARARLRQYSGKHKNNAPIPFPRKAQS